MLKFDLLWHKDGRKRIMKYTKKTFPRCTIDREGIKNIKGVIDIPSCTTLCDVKYRQVNGYDLHLHIILPTQEKEEKRRFPLVMFVQGSAWHKQTLGREITQLARIACQGYVIAIVEYRPSDIAHFPAQIIDTKYATQFMVENCDTYFVDPNQIVIWGTSSGAHTAMMTAFTKGMEQFTPSDVKEYTYRCVIDYYGPTDVYEMRFQPSLGEHCTPDCPEGLLIGDVVTKENSKDTVVMNYVNSDTEIPPVLILHGDMDSSVNFEQSILLYDKMKMSGKKVEFYRVQNAGHAGAQFFSHDAFKIVDEFIQKYL